MNLLSLHDVNSFKAKSVLHLKSLFPRQICEDARQYFLENESQIIDQYSNNKRGLVTETISGNVFLKYFEFPLQYNSFVFGRFLTSDIFLIGSELLESPVRFVSAEIHTRYTGASEIPVHQDNAYYGLINGKALTFYIALDNQLASSGGLQYIANTVVDEFDHKPSKSSAFSLTLTETRSLDKREVIQPVYEPGDCTIHHSRSIHFAEPVPISSRRSVVFRVSLYAQSAVKRDGHDQLYQELIAKNRSSQGF